MLGDNFRRGRRVKNSPSEIAAVGGNGGDMEQGSACVVIEMDALIPCLENDKTQSSNWFPRSFRGII
jgi:hypothetical protein